MRQTTEERVAELVKVEDDTVYVDGELIGWCYDHAAAVRRAKILREVLVREIDQRDTWKSSEDLRRVAEHLRKKSQNESFSSAERARHARAAAFLEMAYAELLGL